MAMILKCNECGHRIVMPKGKFPDSCPECGWNSSLPVDDVVAMPAFLSAKTRANDGVYRAMEEGAEHRMNVAAEVTGLDRSEFADMKITDLKDARHAGEVAAIELPANPVSIRMEQMRAAGMPVGFGEGASYSGAVASGPFPNAGAHIQQAIRSRHRSVEQHVRSSPQHADTQYGSVSPGAPLSEMPSNQVLEPGYRPRVR